MLWWHLFYGPFLKFHLLMKNLLMSMIPEKRLGRWFVVGGEINLIVLLEWMTSNIHLSLATALQL